jgi:alpha-1,3-rhamnosyltransferase
MAAPLVSVLVPSFNHEPFITQALDSITEQSYRNIEVVIVDDCSSDNSVERIREWIDRTTMPVQLVLNDENRGICSVLNQLVSLASGEFLVYLDSDDWFDPDRIQIHVDHFESLGPEVVLVYGDVELWGEDGRRVGATSLQQSFRVGEPPDGSRVFDRLLLANFIPTPAVTVRRSAILEIGGYDESLWFDDYDMWLRLSHRFDFSFCDRVVANYRVLPSSMSHSVAGRPEMARSTIVILERWADTPDVRESLSRRRSLANNLRRQSCKVAPYDLDLARKALATAQRLDPSVQWRCIEALRVLAWPHGPELVARMSKSWSAASQAVRRRLK